jgi:hypothetical protein
MKFVQGRAICSADVIAVNLRQPEASLCLAHAKRLIRRLVEKFCCPLECQSELTVGTKWARRRVKVLALLKALSAPR